MTVGVDEVGRGCLAGPVVVGAVVFPVIHQKIPGIKDSKKLSRKQRENLEPKIIKSALAVGIGKVSVRVIDKLGIVKALEKAANIAVGKVLDKVRAQIIMVDWPKTMALERFGVKVTPIVDGDEKIYEISAASIVAKVYRDELMSKWAKKDPDYGWETNVGYGTKKHFEAINKLGLTPLHRKSFISGLFRC